MKLGDCSFASSFYLSTYIQPFFPEKIGSDNCNKTNVKNKPNINYLKTANGMMHPYHMVTTTSMILIVS